MAMGRSDRIGLGIATAGHVLLIAVLSFGLLQRDVVIPPSPPAIEVSIADAVSLESRTTAPSVPQQAQAPEEGVVEPDATPPPPAPEPEATLVPQPRDVAPPPAPAPAPKPTPRPAPPKAEPKPQPRVETPPKKPAPAATPAPAKASPAKTVVAKPTPQRAPRLGADFLKGLDDARPSRPTTAPAASAPMGAIATRALNAEINRQIKPFWRPPSGADADQLVTLLSVHLDRSGAVVGEIEVVDQTGITASNRAQAALHAERAVQSVRRASPFQNLPAEYYDQWKWLKPLKFDARLAQ